VKGARARVEKALAQNPNQAGPLVLLAKVYRTTGDTEKMKQLLNHALEIEPSFSEAYGMLGHLYISEGQIHEAKTRYEEMARLQPTSVGAATMMGLLNFQEGNRSEAKKWWQNALAIDPNAVTAANNLAWLYVQDDHDLETALQLARRAQSRFPDEPEFNDTVGWVYYRQNALGEAIWYLTQSTQKNPNNAVFQFHLGMAYARKGEDASARRYLQRALTLDKNFPEADEARKTIASLVY
jgi:Tfp pilus assembly protein PilF